MILSVARATRIAVTCLVLAPVVAGCGGDRAAPNAVKTTPARYHPRVEPPVANAGAGLARPTRRTAAAPRIGPAVSRCARAPVTPLRTTSVAFAAVVRSTATAYATPAGERLARFGRLNANGVPTVLGVLGRARCRGEWLRVQLPLWPNGAIGWVLARELELVRVGVRIEVDLSERRVVLLRRGRPLLEARAAVGASGTPTPTGSYYVNQRLVAPDPGGPFGPAAIGISAFSPVLRHWKQGGPIAIHGTNEPHLIGGAVSHGCVRVRNDILVRLYRLAVPGTPVVIRT